MVPTLVVIELDRLKRNCGGNHKRVWPQSVREIRCTNCDLRNGRRFFNLLARKLHRGLHILLVRRLRDGLWVAFRLQPVPKTESAKGSA
jgi:hypothetical protein